MKEWIASAKRAVGQRTWSKSLDHDNKFVVAFHSYLHLSLINTQGRSGYRQSAVLDWVVARWTGKTAMAAAAGRESWVWTLNQPTRHPTYLQSLGFCFYPNQIHDNVNSRKHPLISAKMTMRTLWGDVVGVLMSQTLMMVAVRMMTMILMMMMMRTFEVMQ